MNKNQILITLNHAIINKKVITFYYGGKKRTGEPYRTGKLKTKEGIPNKDILEFYQTDVFPKTSKVKPEWRPTLFLDQITKLEIADESFEIRVDFKKMRKDLRTVYRQVDQI